jgi:hypothetical protein
MPTSAAPKRRPDIFEPRSIGLDCRFRDAALDNKKEDLGLTNYGFYSNASRGPEYVFELNKYPLAVKTHGASQSK